MMKAGISRDFTDLFLLPDYYQQTLATLTIGNKKYPMFWTYSFETYALQFLLKNTLDGCQIDSLIPSGLRRLMEYDKKHNRQCTKTLEVYLEEDRHIANAIKKLYMQRATFLYQLKRILEISELDLENSDIRLELNIVFKLMNL